MFSDSPTGEISLDTLEEAVETLGKALGLSDDIKLLAEKSEDGLHASLAMLQRGRRHC